MHGDFSRLTFDPGRGFRSVLMQQGRVLLDSDWNEQVDIDCYSAVVTWNTNKPATSRVVYDTEAHDDISTGAPDYGYAFSTEEDTNKVTGHQVTIYGLEPGVEYYFFLHYRQFLKYLF